LARFFFVWGQFGFFSFRLIKLNRTGQFFQNSNRFFFTIRFFFFFNFLDLIDFSVFFSPLKQSTIHVTQFNTLVHSLRGSLFSVSFVLYNVLRDDLKG
jgi:hypothetical protein